MNQIYFVMLAEEAINTIWAMWQTYRTLYHGDVSTHVLMHPRLEQELYDWHEQHAYTNGSTGSPINRRDRTIFGMAIITVHNKPYPFIAIAKVITNEQPQSV